MFKKKEILSIPNILGYFRILLIPVFITIYMNALSVKDYFIAAIIIGISSLTDMFDGLIARKFNMITELGIFVDPLADKLTQGAFIFCLTLKYKPMLLLIIIFVIKESFMGIMGLYVFKKYNTKLSGAKWFGKVCTALLDTVLFVLLLIPNIPASISNFLIYLCGCVMLATFVLYIRVYVKMLSSIKNNNI